MAVAESGLHKVLTKFSGLKKQPDFSAWEEIIKHQTMLHDRNVTIGLVAKYMDNEDTYISVLEALKAAAWHKNLGIKIKWINAETVQDEDFEDVDGIVVPGGFGSRGVEGKITAARYALDNNVPYLGICLGLQVAVIAAARKAGLKDANSTEFADTPSNVVYLMEGQEGKESTGGTMRLGDYPAVLQAGSHVTKVYANKQVVERHRHRYEVNKKFVPEIEKGGLTISGTSPDGTLVEFVESPNHSYFVATQAHPEFKSRPSHPHPLFVGLLSAV